jgi:aminopeptidase N
VDRRGGAGGRLELGGAGTGADAGEGGHAGEPDLPSDLTRDILSTALVVDVKNREGIATITLAPSSSRAVSFEIGDLEIEAVESESQPLDFADTGARLDIVVEPSSQPLSLVIRYRYQLHDEMDGVSTDGYTFTWPYYCGNVFPCHSDPSDGMTFTLSVTGSTRDVVYAKNVSAPAPSYMLAWIEGSFGEIPLGYTTYGTEVVAFYDENAASSHDDALAGTEHLVAAFDWMERTFGSYAFGSKVGPVPTTWPPNGIGGMEHHPFWHTSPRSLGREILELHEAAHGWFGNGVRIRCWADLVLSEGLVSYVSARALDEVGETDAAVQAFSEYEGTVESYRAGGDLPEAWREDCGDASDFDAVDNVLMYARGALFFRALEQKLGREALYAILAQFYANRLGESAGLGDLLDEVLQASGFDATSCAKAWLLGPTLPDYLPCE